MQGNVCSTHVYFCDIMYTYPNKFPVFRTWLNNENLKHCAGGHCIGKEKDKDCVPWEGRQIGAVVIKDNFLSVAPRCLDHQLSNSAADISGLYLLLQVTVLYE